MIKAILWDINGVLGLTETLRFASLVDVCATQDIVIDCGLRTLFAGSSAERVHRHLVEQHGLKISFREFATSRYVYYREHANTIRPRPGALEAWRDVSRLGLQQALVSNSDRLLVDVNIEALGLTRPRLISISINDVRCGKPDPEAYLRAAYLLDVVPGECIAVEDSPSGALSAIQAGMTTVVWPEDNTLIFEAGCIRVDDIGQLFSVIEANKQTDDALFRL
jgi:HAD superfamily hydrolase (TIGR01509 family)